MTSDAIIALHNVSKSYPHREVPVLDQFSAELLAGEFVSLMGPSGTGKTTILNLIAGLDSPDQGAVLICGQNLRALGDRQLSRLRLSSIGFVFQSFNLMPELTVQENLEWPLEFAGKSRAEVRSRVASALDLVGMSGFERRFPSQLSGGEQQRIAIARAIAPQPPILLADEPTGNLDSHTGETILDLLRLLNVSLRTTVVMVTHNVFAATYGHRTIELRDGRALRDVRLRAEPRLTVVHPNP